MKNSEASILNAIPADIDLNSYFDSLSIFEKRELINELEFNRENHSKNVRRMAKLVLFSHLVSLGCYLVVQQEWFFYYLICIHTPMDVLLFFKIKSARTYKLAVEYLEKRMNNS